MHIAEYHHKPAEDRGVQVDFQLLCVLEGGRHVAVVWANLVCGADCLLQALEVDVTPVSKIIDQNCRVGNQIMKLSPFLIGFQHGVHRLIVVRVFKRVLNTLCNALSKWLEAWVHEILGKALSIEDICLEQIV